MPPISDLQEPRFNTAKLYGPGAKWRGSIKNCGEVSYEFQLQIPSIPPAVIATRNEMDLGEAVWARTVLCVCPNLQLRENVVVSSDSHGRLLLQSLIKPELGKLCLRQYSKDKMTFLLGGDEQWSESDPPEVEVSLLRAAEVEEECEKTDEETANQFVYAAAHGNLDDMKRMIEEADQAREMSSSGSTPESATTVTTSTASGSSTQGTTVTVGNANGSTAMPSNVLTSVDVYATVGPFSGCTAIQSASEKGRIEVVNWLLDVKKANLHLKSIEGLGVVHYACTKTNNIQVLEKLLACRADPNYGFETVCTRGDDKALQCLLNWQTSANTLDDCIRTTAKNGHGKCLIMLLSMQKYRNDGVLNQALQLACVSGKTSTVKILLQHQADPMKCSGDENLNAMQLAEQHERDKVVEVLKNHVPARKPGRNILAELNGRGMNLNVAH